MTLFTAAATLKLNTSKVMTFTTALTLTALLTGCGSTAAQYQPIVDGPKDALYNSDLAACSELAEQREYLNDDVKSEALLGAGIGALAGLADDGGSGAVAGALVGSAAAAGGRAWETRDERKAIVVACMRGRGHKVVG
ncbi:MAG: hypothetical protein OIF57_10960 [Marinobacterium sp.]|nr:hypothetical protein [Marinobacterium sp.]